MGKLEWRRPAFRARDPLFEMSKKTKDPLVLIPTDAEMREIIKNGPVFMEVYSNHWGRCVCIKATIQKLYFSFMDVISFHSAIVEDIKSLQADDWDCIEPVYVFFKDGKRFKVIHGADGPAIEAGLQELKEACA